MLQLRDTCKIAQHVTYTLACQAGVQFRFFTGQDFPREASSGIAVQYWRYTDTVTFLLKSCFYLCSFSLFIDSSLFKGMKERTLSSLSFKRAEITFLVMNVYCFFPGDPWWSWYCPSGSWGWGCNGYGRYCGQKDHQPRRWDTTPCPAGRHCGKRH